MKDEVRAAEADLTVPRDEAGDDKDGGDVPVDHLASLERLLQLGRLGHLGAVEARLVGIELGGMGCEFVFGQHAGCFDDGIEDRTIVFRVARRAGQGFGIQQFVEIKIDVAGIEEQTHDVSNDFGLTGPVAGRAIEPQNDALADCGGAAAGRLRGARIRPAINRSNRIVQRRLCAPQPASHRARLALPRFGARRFRPSRTGRRAD